MSFFYFHTFSVYKLQNWNIFSSRFGATTQTVTFSLYFILYLNWSGNKTGAFFDI